MFDFLEMIICMISLFFPIMVYCYYVLYKKNFKEKEKLVIQNLLIFFTLFLIINLTIYFDKNIYFIFVTIPILFCYIYRNKVMTFICSLVVSMYYFIILDLNIFLIIFLNIAYLCIYICYIRSNRNISFLFNGFYFSNIIFIILTIYFKYGISTFNLNIIIVLLIYLIFILILEYGYLKTNEIINTHMLLKEFEHEKQIQTSLFKITHEIKNPLAVINGYLQMYDINDKNKSKEYIKIIKDEVNRMLNLLDDFREFTKIKVKKERIDFNDLLDDVKKTVIPMAKKRNVVYEFKTEKNLILDIDYNRMKQVLINIIKNAIEACEKDGFVKVTAFIDNEKLCILIKDNGVGMTKEVMDNLLKPFYTTKPFGTGLGICLSKEIINAHEGILEYNSKVKEGTVFKILLPKVKND